MSKRFTDTSLPDKEWFMQLGVYEKEAYRYIKDKCDNVGVWDVNKSLAEIQIGDKINWEYLIDNCNGNIIVLSNKKWWLIDFCYFQYEIIDPEDVHDNARLSYIKLLKHHGLYEKYLIYIKNKGLMRGSIEPKDKDKDKDKEKEKDKDKSAFGSLQNVYLTGTQYEKLVSEFGNQTTGTYIEKLSVYIPNRIKKPYRDHYAAIKNFLLGDNIQPLRVNAKIEITGAKYVK